MRWLYDLHAWITDTRWLSRVTPALVVVILLTLFGATGLAMCSYVFWAIPGEHASSWRRILIMVGPNFAAILLAIVIAAFHIRRNNRDRAERTAKMRNTFISM